MSNPLERAGLAFYIFGLVGATSPITTHHGLALVVMAAGFIIYFVFGDFA